MVAAVVLRGRQTRPKKLVIFMEDQQAKPTETEARIYAFQHMIHPLNKEDS